MKQCSIKVIGKVQGVFFRASAKQEADKLNIHGIVRNENDGSVSIIATGDEENLDRFITWCKQGPPFARVDRCEVTAIPFQHFEVFTILR